MTLTNKILLGLFTGVGLVIIVAFFWLSLANAHLKTQLAHEQAKNAAYVLANDAFSSQVEAQNKALEALKADGALREKRAQEAADAAQEKARIFFIAAENLRKMKARGDACKAADALFTAYLGEPK
jgi:hypothetical protein